MHDGGPRDPLLGVIKLKAKIATHVLVQKGIIGIKMGLFLIFLSIVPIESSSSFFFLLRIDVLVPIWYCSASPFTAHVGKKQRTK